MNDFKQYVKANLRLEKLLDVVDDNTPLENPSAKEFIEVSDIIEQYEETYFPMGLPTLQEMIELRMFEMGLEKEDLATLLDISESRMGDYLNGKREITLDIARALHNKLNIDSDIILQ